MNLPDIIFSTAKLLEA